MRRHWKQLTLITIGLLAAAIVCLWPRDHSPIYEGRRLSEWTAIYSRSLRERTSAAETNAAADAIRQIGTNGLPFLLLWMDFEPTQWRYTTVQRLPTWLQHLPLTDWLFISQDQTRAYNAAAAFSALGGIARPAIPELTRRANLPSRKSGYAILALSSLGPPAIPALEKIVTDPKHAANPWTMLCIRLMGTNAEPLIPVLVNHLRGSNAVSAQNSAHILGRLKAEPETVVPALASALSHAGNSSIQVAAANALEEFGETARLAIPALCSALTNSAWDVRYYATNALLKISPGSLAPSLR